jgi:hypothetical protein
MLPVRWGLALPRLQVPGVIAAMWALDNLGRLPTLTYSCLLCAASTGAMAVVGPGPAAIVLLFLARAAALAFNQSLWILASEVRILIAFALTCFEGWLPARQGGALWAW